VNVSGLDWLMRGKSACVSAFTKAGNYSFQVTIVNVTV